MDVRLSASVLTVVGDLLRKFGQPPQSEQPAPCFLSRFKSDQDFRGNTLFADVVATVATTPIRLYLHVQ